MSATLAYPTSAPPSIALRVPAGRVLLDGRLSTPEDARGLIIIASGDGDHLYDRANAKLAELLTAAGFATLTLDLLTAEEKSEDAETSALRFNTPFLAARLVWATSWTRCRKPLSELKVGYVASGLCAAAALAAAAASRKAAAVVCFGGRVDLASGMLGRMPAEVLLLVGDGDTAHARINREVLRLLPEGSELELVPDAGHLLDEAAVVEHVACRAEHWFARTLEADGVLAW